MTSLALRATDELAEAIAAQAPCNPFASRAYRAAMDATGYESWILAGDLKEQKLSDACYAFVRRGRLNTDLTIVSIPSVDPRGELWTALRALCREQGVTRLEVESFASPAGTVVPPLADDEARRSRQEFVLDLSSDAEEGMSRSHRRNARRAADAGTRVVRTKDAAALLAHQELMRHSLMRRRSRGEQVPDAVESRERTALLATGSGELFQAMKDDVVLSSVLVLRADRGGYAQSAGTSQEGMALGASHFLQREISRHLRADGATTYGLGGAEPGSSLAEFKSLFGASTHEVPHVSCTLGTRLTRASNGIAALWRGARTSVAARLE